VGVTTFASVCLLSFGAGCSHRATGSGSSSSTSRGVVSSPAATTTSPPALGTGGDALYGDYVRPEFGLIKKPALRHHSDEWSVVFPEPGAWKGVVVILYWGHKTPFGHAYAYQATKDGSLRLGQEARAPSRIAADGLGARRVHLFWRAGAVCMVALSQLRIFASEAHSRPLRHAAPNPRGRLDLHRLMPIALDNGRRSPSKLLRAVVARLLGRKP